MRLSFSAETVEKYETGKMRIAIDVSKFGHRLPTGGGASPYTNPEPQEKLRQGPGSGHPPFRAMKIVEFVVAET